MLARLLSLLFLICTLPAAAQTAAVQAYTPSGLHNRVFLEVDELGEFTGYAYLLVETKDPRAGGNTLSFWLLDEDLEPIAVEGELEMKILPNNATLFGFRGFSSPTDPRVIIPKGLAISGKKSMPAPRPVRFTAFHGQENRFIGNGTVQYVSGDKFRTYLWEWDGLSLAYGVVGTKRFFGLGNYLYVEW